ncbi:serine/threonine protein kinase [Arthrobacter sp. AK01]|uniref:serine/threonine protein kinase n=1 Tax=Arthrobacter sp. AK01 TaxID=2894084 RepID=UPI001E48CD3F|nr:serine/threonine-protein kinase [Arthrobacter sp. AK01]MCD4853722.1 serine/threonine protein kinase [Arthrobacter sp. AK01]
MEKLDIPAGVVPLVPGYQISRQLGQGSSSTVWLVTRNSDGVRLAIKCGGGASGESSSGGVITEGVAREVRLLAGFKHQHLVRIHEVLPVTGGAGDTAGIVMDYAAGGSLANLMAGRGILRVGEAVTMLTPLAQALDYLHVNGAVHGDVSPGNVLFTAEGMPLLADFGVAAMVGGAQQVMDAGTPGFRDPSVVPAGGHARRELQPQRDVYSLAAVGWYCLTGSAPADTRHRPPLSLLVPDVPKSLMAALEAALDTDPHVRPTARELGTAIFRSAAPEPLDLSGAVHPSVIPELLTRREALGRSPRRAPRWIRRFHQFPSVGPEATIRPEGRRRRSTGARIKNLALVLAAGMLIGAGGWTVSQQGPLPWQQNQASSTQPAGAIGSSAPSLVPAPGPASSTAAAHAADLPEALAEGLRAEDPAVAVKALSSVRDVALGQGRLDLLALVNVPGSPAEVADNQVADHLKEAGTVFAGFSTTLSGVTVEGSPDSNDVMVGATVATSTFEERDSSGAVAHTWLAGSPQDLRLHVVRTNGRWRISGILAPSVAG